MKASLENSGSILSYVSENTLKGLEDKTTYPREQKVALEWLPKAQQARSLSKKIIDFLEEKKSHETFTKDDIDDIYTYALSYFSDVMKIDPDIDISFGNETPTFSRYVATIFYKGQNSKRKLTTVLPQHLQIAILSVLQNEIRNLEFEIIKHSYYKSYGGCHLSFDPFIPLVTQSGKYLGPGETLEIKAGIGVFSRAAQPDILFKEQKVALNEYNYSSYKMTVSKQPGKYSVPIKISFFNQNTGKDEERIVDIEYTVTKPCNE